MVSDSRVVVRKAPRGLLRSEESPDSGSSEHGNIAGNMERRPRILVIGSANVDLTTFTDSFPRPGETIFGREFHLGFGGKGANQAVAARMCGARVSMVARVGDDLFGAATVQNFTSRGVDASHVMVTAGGSSGVAP